MSPEEAKTFGIPEEDRRLYVRVDRAKVNIARAAGGAKWFRLVGVPLGNATDLYTAGDEVQTAEPWKPPETWADIDNPMANLILSKIGLGLGDGNFYTDAARAGEREAWRVVQADVPSKSEKQAREVVKTWVRNGVLVSFLYDNPITRKSVRGLKVDDEKRPS